MAKSQAVDEQCPIETGLNILSGKWKLKILWHLSNGTIRFNELQRILGNITTKTLTQQLRATLKPILTQLCDWGKKYYTYQKHEKDL